MSTANDELPFHITLRVRDTCLCLHLQQAARAVARRFDAALRPLGLTNGQFSLLMSLNRPEAASIGGVSTLLAMDRTTLTANLKPLERRGLVTVSVDDADKRSRRPTLTPIACAAICARSTDSHSDQCWSHILAAERRSNPATRRSRSRVSAAPSRVTRSAVGSALDAHQRPQRPGQPFEIPCGDDRWADWGWPCRRLQRDSLRTE